MRRAAARAARRPRAQVLATARRRFGKSTTTSTRSERVQRYFATQGVATPHNRSYMA
jgi:hypothetical protein